PPRYSLVPYTTPVRSARTATSPGLARRTRRSCAPPCATGSATRPSPGRPDRDRPARGGRPERRPQVLFPQAADPIPAERPERPRSEEHTSELQSRENL